MENPYELEGEDKLTPKIAFLLLFWFAVRILFTVLFVGIAVLVILLASNTDHIPGVWP